MNKNIFNSLMNNFDHIVRKKTYIPYTPKMKNNSMREMNNELNLFYTGMVIPQNKFISSQLSVSPLTVYNIPTPFEVGILSNNNFQFEFLDKDAKDINFYLYNDSSIYLNTDSNNYTQLSWPASTYSFLPNPYFLDCYKIVTEGNEILCDYASSNLLKGTDRYHPELWRIHKLNKVLPRI